MKNKMKNKIQLTAIIFTVMFIFNSCSKEDNSTSSNGGNGGGGGGITTGKVTITATWSNIAPWNACGSSPYIVVIGLGYNSTDVANESYFSQFTYYAPMVPFTTDSLAPGIYYYGAKKTFNVSLCGTGQGVPPTVKKSGAFTITAGQTTTISGVDLN